MAQKNETLNIDTICATVHAAYPDANKEVLNQFVSCIIDYHSRYDSDAPLEAHISEMAIAFWQLARQRSQDEANIKLDYQEARQELQPNALQITLNMENRAFILNSLLALVARKGMRARSTYHPLMHITRDSSGYVTRVEAAKHTREDTQHLETIIFVEVYEGVTPEIMTSLRRDLDEMIREIRAANEDWRAMRKKALEIADALPDDATKTRHDAQVPEVRAFLRWLENHHFTFLGYAKYTLIEDDPNRIVTLDPDAPPLGIMRDSELTRMRVMFSGIELSERTRKFLNSAFPIIMTKTSRYSRVHRGVHMDCIAIRIFDGDGRLTGLHVFIGLLTSLAYDSSARDIPMIRAKITEIVDRCGLINDWHDGKALVHILDSLPRDELFQGSIKDLMVIAKKLLKLNQSSRLLFFMRRDEFNRYLSCMVYIPRDRFDSHLCIEIQEILEETLQGAASGYKAQFGELPFARVNYIINCAGGCAAEYDQEDIEKRLVKAACLWSDGLKDTFIEQFDNAEAAHLYHKYKGAFDSSYQDTFSAHEALVDIVEIEKMLSDGRYGVRMCLPSDDKAQKNIQLKLYNRGHALSLSDILPTLENLDLRVLTEIPFCVRPSGSGCDVWVHFFSLESLGKCEIDIRNLYREFKNTLTGIRDGHYENDRFNRLVLRAGLNAQQCLLFRAYAKYIRLIDYPFSKNYISQSLVMNPAMTQLLWSYFDARFNPVAQQDAQAIEKDILSALEKVKNQDQDRILNAYYTIIKHTTRTSFFAADDNQHAFDFVAFKIASREIDLLPSPRPMMEIYIYAPDMEAVHLRGGKIARGGIRWSDRREDFRREVLGLVKAQMIKNTVIVPTGSKGGFIVKKPTEHLDRKETQKVAIACYKKMIRALLVLTDNVVDGKVVHPVGMKIHDEADPYLVVAADKGTATFSDYANIISCSLGFWLKDAFASGGSAGYDHKKMGITARGAWECVKRHFRELGHDCQTEPTTIVGIGDMSGDVFGNGMLLSRCIRLRAAFNHMHIFIDPDPDMERSYQERLRLFQLPRSSWHDYDPGVLSAGGRIFDRQEKKLTLTPEIRAFLGIKDATIKPDDLIRMILMSQTDLLWFGGIGTYVKATSESHGDVGDRANDAIRVNAKHLKARVIGEGANLGCTQLGRIEFERTANGRVNTDAIDNSAGVATSDKEVNIKILCHELVRSGELPAEERDRILEDMTTDIQEHVLADNYLQPQAISMLKRMGPGSFDHQIRLIRKLEGTGLLDRTLEHLPDDTTLDEYATAQVYLSRPEIAVVLGYGKIYFTDYLLEADLPDDPYFQAALEAYFPQALHCYGRDYIHRHPLKREIICTYIVNTVLNRLGASFVMDAAENAATHYCRVFQAFFIVYEIFALEDVWQAIEGLDNKITADVQQELLLEVQRIVRRSIMWVLRYCADGHSISDSVEELGAGISAFLQHLTDVVDDKTEEIIIADVAALREQEIPQALAERLAMLKQAASSPDIILISSDTNNSVASVARLYYRLGKEYKFADLRRTINAHNIGKTRWQRKFYANCVEELYSFQSDLITQMLVFAKEYGISAHKDHDALVHKWTKAHQQLIDTIHQSFTEAQLEINLDPAALGVIMRDLRTLSGRE